MNLESTRKRQRDWAKAKRKSVITATAQELAIAVAAQSQRLICRLMARCRVTERGCWEWTGARRKPGYGKIEVTVPGRRAAQMSTHRLSAALHGIIDLTDDLDALHECDNRPCFNPDHLFSGDDSDNMQDCIAKGRKNAPNGDSHSGSVLSDAEVVEIKNRLANGETAVSIAGSFPQVSKWAIYMIKQGRTRKAA